MKGKDLYEFYKGQEVITDKATGIVCGYENPGDCVIIKVTESKTDQGWLLEAMEDNDMIEVKYKNSTNKYWYATKKQLTQIIPLPKKQAPGPMKIYKVDFEPIHPVGCSLIIKARTEQKLLEIITETLTHTDKWNVEEIKLDEEGVIVYQSGEY